MSSMATSGWRSDASLTASSPFPFRDNLPVRLFFEDPPEPWRTSVWSSASRMRVMGGFPYAARAGAALTAAPGRPGDGSTPAARP